MFAEELANEDVLTRSAFELRREIMSIRKRPLAENVSA